MGGRRPPAREASVPTPKKVENVLKDDLRKHSKVKALVEEDYGMKEYLRNPNINEARTQFKMKTKRLKVKTHFWGDKKFSHDLWRCN